MVTPVQQPLNFYVTYNTVSNYRTDATVCNMKKGEETWSRKIRARERIAGRSGKLSNVSFILDERKVNAKFLMEVPKTVSQDKKDFQPPISSLAPRAYSIQHFNSVTPESAATH